MAILTFHPHLPSCFFIKFLANSIQITTNPNAAAPPSMMATVFPVFEDVSAPIHHNPSINKEVNGKFSMIWENPQNFQVITLFFLLFTWGRRRRRRRSWWRPPGNPIWVVAVTDEALMEVDLAWNRAPTFDLSSLHSALHTLTAICVTHIPLALPQHIHRFIAGGIEAMATNHAIFQGGKGGVPSLLKPTSCNIRGAASLEKHLHAWNLRETRYFVENVAAVELNPRGYGLATQPVRHEGKLAYTVVAIRSGEVSPALEEAGDRGLASAGGGLEELGLGGLRNQGAKEGREGLFRIWIWQCLLSTTLVDQGGVISGRFSKWMKLITGEENHKQQEKGNGFCGKTHLVGGTGGFGCVGGSNHGQLERVYEEGFYGVVPWFVLFVGQRAHWLCEVE